MFVLVYFDCKDLENICSDNFVVLNLFFFINIKYC